MLSRTCFPFITEDRIRLARHHALHEVGEETMQLRPGMGRAREAATPEGARFHPEITAVFLNQHVRRHLARAEKAVLALVDRHRLIDPVLGVGMGGVALPTQLLFDKRQRVWLIAINFVCGCEKEGRVRAELAGGFQHHQGSVGVHGEVRIGFRAAQSWLGWAAECTTTEMDFPYRAKIFSIADWIADVRGFMCEAGIQRLLEFFGIPGRGAVGAEKIGAHVVVDPHHLETLGMVELHRFAADEPGRSCDDRDGHISPSLSEYIPQGHGLIGPKPSGYLPGDFL